MRAQIFIALAASAALVIGCGNSSSATPDPSGSSTPAACLQESDAYMQALRTAPGTVRLDNKTPISNCLGKNRDADDLDTVGVAMVEAAKQLNAEARAKPGNAANVQLGYLLGAVRRGSDISEGIQDQLVRRLSSAAGYSPNNESLSREFLRAYTEGFNAGSTNG
jgi:hypothetical protein